MSDAMIHAARLKRARDGKGSLERFEGGIAIWAAGQGYLSKNGGFTKSPSKALLVGGFGEAIATAAVHGLAITSW